MNPNEPWRPPPRPPWVERLLAHGEAAGGAQRLVGLDPDELVATAAATEGHDDFGPPTWRANYDVLLRAVARESELHLAGRIVTRTEVLRSLRTRLGLAARWERDPGVLDRPVTNPVFVVGFARSGTSILHELLALEPTVRAPRTWELLQPADAAAGGEVAARARHTGDHVHAFWADLQPEYATMHHNAGDLPNECIFATAHEFLSDHWSGVHVAPTYAVHLATADHIAAYRYHRRVLQTLQGETSTQWVLKAPSHLPTLATLLAVYPDARVVHIHRDPLRAVPSTLSLMGTLKWMRCTNVDMARLARPTAKGFAAMLDGIIAGRAAGTLPDERFVDVRYTDLVRDPGGMVERVHDALDWPTGPSVALRARDHVAASPRGGRGAHRYSLAAFGLDRGELEARFAAYRERFGVEAEPDGAEAPPAG
jgi:hypothetical protein